MLDASTSALSETHRQLGVLYQRAGTYLSDATLWTKMGATPMIGQNDFKDEVFYLEDAEGLNAFARSKGVVRMSMWSGNRDVACGGNYVDTSIVSDSCSGVEQEKGDFARTLSAGFNGSILQNSGVVTTGDAKAADVKDDPANSPYQIWTEEGTYLQGTKVVWRRNVYEAKWWTQGEMPDNPVLQTWETPWRLIGPVLPGEKPLAQATLPNGTYPEWSGTQMYDAGQRVLFKGAPYQAKWWNQGQSPAAASSNPDGSPWVPLTQAQINEVEEQLKKQS
jgi:chitinase